MIPNPHDSPMTEIKAVTEITANNLRERLCIADVLSAVPSAVINLLYSEAHRRKSELENV